MTENKLDTFDMYGIESINCKNHDHKDGDNCHRCGSTNTETMSDCVSGLMYWVWLECKDCKLGMIFSGGSEQ